MSEPLTDQELDRFLALMRRSQAPDATDADMEAEAKAAYEVLPRLTAEVMATRARLRCDCGQEGVVLRECGTCGNDE